MGMGMSVGRIGDLTRDLLKHQNSDMLCGRLIDSHRRVDPWRKVNEDTCHMWQWSIRCYINKRLSNYEEA